MGDAFVLTTPEDGKGSGKKLTNRKNVITVKEERVFAVRFFTTSIVKNSAPFAVIGQYLAFLSIPSTG